MSRIEPDARLAELADHLTFVEQIEEDIARLKTRLEHVDDARFRRHRHGRHRAPESPAGRRVACGSSSRCAPMTISPGGSISCSASPASANAPRSRSSSACPNSAASAASRPPRSPALPLRRRQRKAQRSAAHRRRPGRLRRSLFAAALPAAFRWNKALIDLYAASQRAAKLTIAALIACARKLLIYANTVVQRGTPWIEKPAAV